MLNLYKRKISINYCKIATCFKWDMFASVSRFCSLCSRQMKSDLAFLLDFIIKRLYKKKKNTTHTHKTKRQVAQQFKTNQTKKNHSAIQQTQNHFPCLRLLIWKSYLKPLQPLWFKIKTKLGKQKERKRRNQRISVWRGKGETTITNACGT